MKSEHHHQNDDPRHAHLAGYADYYCPKCPNVGSDKPGTCSICGEVLKPKTSAPQLDDNRELHEMTRRFWVGVGLASPLLVLAMAHWLSAHAPATHNRVSRGMELSFSSLVVLWAGWPFYLRGARACRSGQWDRFTLMTLGVGVAWLYSLATFFLPLAFPPATGASGTLDVYLEAGIVLLVLLAQVLELHACATTSTGMQTLRRFFPPTVWRVKHGTVKKIPRSKVKIGNRLLVYPGDEIPVDGVVEEGSSVVDESALTGESQLVEKNVGERVIEGTINGSGAFILRVF